MDCPPQPPLPPFVPTPVGPPNEGRRLDVEVACFDAAPSPLWRVTTYDANTGAVISITYVDEAGAPAVPAGNAIACGEVTFPLPLPVEIIGPLGPGDCDEAVRVLQCGPVEIDSTTPVDVAVVGSVTVDDGGGSLTIDGAVGILGAVTVVDGGGSLTVDGTVDLGNQFDDEWELLCDSTPTQFLRRYRTIATGVVAVSNFSLAGIPFAPIGAVGKCAEIVSGTVTVSNFPAVQPVSDNGGSLTVDGAVSIVGPVVVTDGGGPLTVDGTVAVSNFPAVQPVSDGGGSLTVDGAVSILGTVTITDGAGPLTVDGTVAVSNQFDDEYELLCDTVGTFLRRYRTLSPGVVAVADFTLAGVAYVTVGAVTRCPTTISGTVTVTGNTGSSNTTAIINTRVFGAFPAAGSQRLTSALARRITILWDNSTLATGSRPSLNGVPLFQLASQGNAHLIIGDLRAPGTLPVLDIRTNLATDDLTVIEEL